nr:MAG TPA: minor capsid protein [Caudoviricetes sp.]
MNKRQKEVIEEQLHNEEKTIASLKNTYKQALKDCEQKIRELSARTDMENLQSIIYQKQYQEALKAQLEGVLANLQSNSYATVSDYLTKCYRDGYTGVMYDLQQTGIPIIMPIDQAAVVRAIQTDSKLSKSLYDKMGEDVTYLKKAVRAEVSRGIANGSTWNEVAGKLSRHMANTPFQRAYNNSIRIARTEGHRIQVQSAMDAQKIAKSKGADIVKQWDSTLDGNTRDLHRLLDGQIREIDEPFEVGGRKVEAPGMFGDPAEDCNCRCCLLQRARWALDDDELQRLKDRAAYFDLDKSDEFEEYQRKYLGITQEDIDNIKNNDKIKNIDTQLKNLKKQFSDITDGYSYDDWFSEFTSIEDGYGRATADDEPDVIKLKDISKKIKNLFSERSTLHSKLPTLGVQGKTFSIEDSLKWANPKYVSGTQYGVNCQRCVQAYELRRRGYDVEALPKPKKNNTIIWGNECFVDSSGNTPSFTFNQSEKAIRNALANAPDGSRHIIYTAWKNSKSAHVFIAEKENGIIRYIDPQSNMDDVEYYFSLAKKNKFGILRVDDKDITTDISKLSATVRW